MFGIQSGVQGNVLRLAKVVSSNPEENSVDVMFIDNGTRAAGVQVMSQSASSKGGVSYLPDPSVDHEGGKWSLSATGDRDIYAVVALVSRMPVVIGFMFPQVTHAAFKDYRNMRLDRHASDLEVVTLDNGSHTVRHPCGTHTTIGEVPELEEKDFDRVYARERNLRPEGLAITQEAKKVKLNGEGKVDQRVLCAKVEISPLGHVLISAHDGDGVERASVKLIGDFEGGGLGRVNVWTDGDLVVEAGKNVRVESVETVEVKSGMIKLN